MSEQYDPRHYLRMQQQETYRAFIVHAPAMRGKTAWARSLRDKLSVYLFDVQQYFVDHPELAEEIDRFDPDNLEHLLLALDISESVVVVDNVDFLLNVWTPASQDHLLGIVERRLKSPGVTDKVFVFMTQDHPRLLRRPLPNSHGQPRVLPLRQFTEV